jgi:Ca2+-binding EF-hand superfamily protein
MDPQAVVGLMMDRMDTDHDGRLSEAELPEQMRQGFAAGDKNKDGFLDAAELAAAMRRRAALRGGAPDGGPPPSGGAGL